MRAARHHCLRAETPGGMACGIELRVAREGGSSSSVAVRRKHARQANSGSPDIGGTHLHASQILVNAQRLCSDIPVAKMGIDTDGGEELHLIARRQRRQIVLEPLYVYRRVRGNAVAAVAKKQLLLRGVNRRKRERRDRILKSERETRKRRHQRLKNEGECPGNVVLQPQIRKNRRDSAARVDGRVLAKAVLQRDARSPSIPVRRVGWLGIVE